MGRFAKLVLQSNNLENKNFYHNPERTKLTWTNIDFKTILGDLYDKHDQFKIVLYQMANGATNNDFGNVVDEKLIDISISGLKFENATYRAENHLNNSNSIISSYLFYSDHTRPKEKLLFDMDHSAIFTKESISTITIEYFDSFVDRLIIRNTPTGWQYPLTVFYFNIYPIIV